MESITYRSYFPITESAIYLNHAAVSPFSTKVKQALDKLIYNRLSSKIEVFDDFVEVKKRLKMNIAAMINGRADNIAIISNTSEGFNWLVNGLTWQAGDRVLLVEGEFPSNIYPFLNLQKKGVIVDFLPKKNQAVDRDDLIKHLHPKTRLFSVSFVGFLHGYRHNLQGLGDICRQRNVIFSVDGIQGVGACPINVQEAGIDFMSNGGHKWLMGPQGCGFMYISPALFEQLQVASVGWLSVRDSWNFFDYQLDLLEDAGRFEIGTGNVTGIYGLKAATDLLLEAGIGQIMNHLLKLGQLLISQLESLGFKYIGPRKNEQRSGIYSFQVDNEQKLYERLQKYGVHLSLRNNLLRFSPHFYNSIDEVQKVIDFCKIILNKSP